MGSRPRFMILQFIFGVITRRVLLALFLYFCGFNTKEVFSSFFCLCQHQKQNLHLGMVSAEDCYYIKYWLPHYLMRANRTICKSHLHFYHPNVMIRQIEQRFPFVWGIWNYQSYHFHYPFRPSICIKSLLLLKAGLATTTDWCSHQLFPCPRIETAVKFFAIWFVQAYCFRYKIDFCVSKFSRNSGSIY